MGSLTLYQMTAEAQELAKILKADDVDDQTILDTLESIGLDIASKGSGYIAVLKELEVWEKAFEEEEKRLANCKKIMKSRKDLLKKRLKECAELLGLKKIETERGIISIRKSPPSLNIQDEKLIPPSFSTIIPEHLEPNKEAIKEALRSGKEVPGCQLMQGTYLKIT